MTKKEKGHELFCFVIVALEGLGREDESGFFDSSMVVEPSN